MAFASCGALLHYAPRKELIHCQSPPSIHHFLHSIHPPAVLDGKSRAPHLRQVLRRGPGWVRSAAPVGAYGGPDRGSDGWVHGAVHPVTALAAASLRQHEHIPASEVTADYPVKHLATTPIVVILVSSTSHSYLAPFVMAHTVPLMCDGASMISLQPESLSSSFRRQFTAPFCTHCTFISIRIFSRSLSSNKGTASPGSNLPGASVPFSASVSEEFC